MNKPQFHARRMQNGTEFQCERCGGLVVRMSGSADTDQLPYVMYCNACDIESGDWQDEKEPGTFSESMTIE
jgi:transcription elongation factor Elf1